MKTFLVVAGVVVVIAIAYVITTNTNEPTPIQNNEEETGIAFQNVEYFASTTGYLAYPKVKGTYPGLILIHEWWGLNDDIKSIADRFAKEGYVALAVDMYNGTSTTDSVKARELSIAVREDIPGAFENLEAAVVYLKSQDNVNDAALASVGWCFGGGWSYQMAINELGTNASVMYYGQFDPEDDFEMMKSHILGHFGEEDMGIAVDTVKEFQAALETTNGMHEIYIYPNVGHGFANARGGTNMAYSEEEAELAWERTKDFLEKIFSSN